MYTGQAGVRPTDGASAAAYVPALCGQVPEPQSDARLLASRPVPVHGLRAADLSRESARHRDLSAGAGLKLYHLGFRGRVARSTLADANETHDWRIFADFAHEPDPHRAHALCGRQLRRGTGATRSTRSTRRTIDLCLSLFPWAHFRRTRRRSSCTRCWTCAATSRASCTSPTGKCTMSTSSTRLAFEPGASTSWTAASRFRAPLPLHQAARFFVMRAKANLEFARRYSHPVDKTHRLALRPDDRPDRRASPRTGYPAAAAAREVLRRRHTTSSWCS